MKGKIYIGTSGWSYKHWKGTFYPADVKEMDHFEYYRKFFNSVELNNSFYHLPSKEVFENWRASVPDDFVFAVKASRYITHMKKLNDPAESIANFMENVVGLQEKLGVILFQLPPHWKRNISRLQQFLSKLPKGQRYTFEFRDADWYHEETLALLREYNCAFCIYHLAGHLSPIEVTADFVYVRLHGPGGKYQGSYSNDELREWAGRCKTWKEEGKDVFVYFDNDEAGYAAYNAIRLKELTGPQ